MPTSCPTCGTENSDGSRFCRQCAAPLPPTPPPGASLPTVESPPGPPPGTISADRVRLATGIVFAGRYRIIEELGEGGMGRVYKAYDTKIREKVALKLVRPEIASDQRILERFANEIRLARRITHRNVCRMHDLGDEGGTPFITMEYVSGEDLKSMIRMTGGLSPAQTVSIGRQIASGLAEAHRLGVVHRDLKPQNVMIDREGTARIMDFGIAHSMRTKGLTDRGVSIGTPEYMSPEQAEGEEVDARSDIYSLGIILFEMATGKPPFQGRSALAVAMKHKAEPPPDPAVENPRVPADLSRLILKCLEKDKDARYASADELGVELNRIASDLPAATPALPPHRTTAAETMRKARWRKALIPAVAALVIVVAAALVTWTLAGRRAAPGAPGVAVNRNAVAIVGFDNETGDARFDHLRKAIPRLLITSLENTGRFKVATWERMKDVLSQAGRKDVDVIDAEGGFQVCQREGIAFIVTGSFTKAGDVFATDAKILDARSRALVKSVTSRGEGENSILRTQLDEIGREIARGLTPAGDGPVRVQPLIDVTTSSMDAYAAYLRGVNARERLYDADAIGELTKAVEIDPKFAIAHSELAAAYASARRPQERDREIELARLHSANATERERLRIEARYATYVLRDWTKRVASLKELVARYPDDKQGYFQLGLSYRGRSNDESIRFLQRALDLDPGWGLALNEIAFTYVEQQKLDLAMRYLEKYAAVNPGDANPLDSIADVQLRMGRLDDAMATFRRVIDIRPDFGADYRLAAVAAMKEDYQAAFAWTDSMIARATTGIGKADGYGMRAILCQLTGRSGDAHAALRAARDILAKTQQGFRVDLLKGWIDYDNQAWAESRKAFRSVLDALRKGMPPVVAEAGTSVLLGTVDWAEGRQASARSNVGNGQSAIARAPDDIPPSITLGIRRLQAWVLAGEGKPDEAIALLAQAWPGPLPGAWAFDQMVTYMCPLAQDDLARLYVRKKDWTRAIAEYKVLTVIGPGHTNRRLVHPIYHYRLAQVYEQAGNTVEAVAEYERFLELWDKADGKRVEIGDARERLAALRAQRPARGVH